MIKIELLGIDLAKNVFQLWGTDAAGNCVLQRRVRRESLLDIVGALPPCCIGIEACTGAFFWQRRVRSAWPSGQDHCAAIRKTVRKTAEE